MFRGVCGIWCIIGHFIWIRSLRKEILFFTCLACMTTGIIIVVDLTFLTMLCFTKMSLDMIMSTDMQLLSYFSYWCVLLPGSLSFTVWLVCASWWCCGPVICIITMDVSEDDRVYVLAMVFFTLNHGHCHDEGIFFCMCFEINDLFCWWIGHWEQIFIL